MLTHKNYIMNITTKESEAKLTDVKECLNVDIIKELTSERKVNGFVNGSTRDIASLKINIIDPKKRSQNTIENAEKKNKVQISMNDNENRPKSTDKKEKGSFVCDTSESEPSCYDSNENILHLNKTELSVSCNNSRDSGQYTLNLPEILSVPNSVCLDVKNKSEDYNTDFAMATDKLLNKFENLNLATDQPSCKENIKSPELPIKYVQYENELQMPMIMKIIQKDLSEPYSIYTYRYFIHNWPKLCFLVRFQYNESSNKLRSIILTSTLIFIQ